MKINKLTCSAVFCILAQLANAETALKVSGTNPTGNQVTIEYSMEDLLALDQTEYVTLNDYVDAPTLFSGPLLRDILGDFDLANADSIVLRAINEYEVKMPAAEAAQYDVIVAVLADGKKMSVREKGPLWLMYPITDNVELQDPIFNSRLIWQLDEIELP